MSWMCSFLIRLMFQPQLTRSDFVNVYILDCLMMIAHDYQQIPGDGTIASSWAGGTNGMEVTNRFLALVPNLLSPTGNCYLVLLKDNNPEELCLDLHKFGLKSQITLQRRCGSEYLSIVRLSLQTKPN